MLSFLHVGKFIDPDTFEMVDALGYAAIPMGYEGVEKSNDFSIFIMPEAELAERYLYLSKDLFDHTVEITRQLSDWRPARETLVPMFDWCEERCRAWSSYKLLRTSARFRDLTIAFTFADPKTAVEFKLVFG